MAVTPVVLLFAASMSAQTPAAPASAAPPAVSPGAPVHAAPGAPTAPSGAASPAAPAGPTPAAAAAPPPAGQSGEAYTYDPAGRRDPFVTLLGTGADAHATSKRGDGAAGMAVSDLSVRGVMQSRGTLVAMVQGPDNKTYLVHPGDRLLDGTIKTIIPQGVVIVQQVNDPLSPVKQREIRKLLRGLEDTK